jgi:mRNA-degrading endonuclease RelE of RelBE toxin-antitoxin system
MTMIIVIMVNRRAYALLYTHAVKEHLRAIDPKYYSLIRDKIQEQLEFEPAVETRNRKPLRQPAAYTADWEIRFGPDNRVRVLYDVDPEAFEVHILAVGEKKGSRLWFGKEKVDL